jgi:hypothetical protein
MAPDDEPKVKDLLAGDPALDPTTLRDLERWFGLPSFEQLAERPPAPPEDPEDVALRERREAAIAAVDPALLASIRHRSEDNPETLLELELTLDVHVDPGIARFDPAMVDRGNALAEPREVDIPEALRDDLMDVTPQALLRDLHRAELFFDKQFEVVDMAAEQRFDIVAEVATAMATSWKLPPLDKLPEAACRELLAELRAYRRRPWPELLRAQPLPNRRIERDA